MNRLTAHGFVFFAFVFLSLCCAAKAQRQATADENYTLNITESRTTESVYERSTAVETSGAANNAPVSVRVGASVRAENIVITLRGITGNVRFRASLEKISRLFR